MTPDDIWSAWQFDPLIVAGLALAGGLYLAGALKLRRRANVRGRPARTRQAAYFAAGWVALVVALLSPLHPLGEALFSAHMVQHELLMTVAAPLLVMGRPLVPFLWALPAGWRRGLGRAARAPAVRSSWRWLSGIGVAWLIQALVLWLWHAPRFFQATLRSDAVHAAQHLCFLGAALLFWWSLLRPGRRGRYGVAVLSLFTTAVQSGVLGALITFAPAVWYPAYGGRGAVWGFTPLQDQQLAGLIMWVPAGVAYLIAGLALFAAWLRESEWRMMQREQHTLIAARR